MLRTTAWYISLLVLGVTITNVSASTLTHYYIDTSYEGALSLGGAFPSGMGIVVPKDIAMVDTAETIYNYRAVPEMATLEHKHQSIDVKNSKGLIHIKDIFRSYFNFQSVS